LHSPALIADGNHARVDGFVSLSVIASAILVALGLPRADAILATLHVIGRRLTPAWSRSHSRCCWWSRGSD
jgi:hypothetical protein